MYRSRQFWMFSIAALLILGTIAAPFVVLSRVMPGEYRVNSVSGERFAQFSAGSIRYQDEGDGDMVVLFLHGFNAHLGQWDAVWQRLADCSCRRIRLDVPGFGQSHWSGDDFSLPRQAERIIALMDHLGLQRVMLVGTSMGASLSASIAAAYPRRISRVLLMAPSAYPNGLTYSGLFGAAVRPGLLNRSAGALARSRLYRRLFPSSRAIQTLSLTASYGKPWAEALHLIEAPTLLLWSRTDGTANPATGTAISQSIRNNTLVWLDASAGHSIPNNRPELAARAVQYLAEGGTPALFEGAAPSLLNRGEGSGAR